MSSSQDDTDVDGDISLSSEPLHGGSIRPANIEFTVPGGGSDVGDDRRRSSASSYEAYEPVAAGIGNGVKERGDSRNC